MLKEGRKLLEPELVSAAQLSGLFIGVPEEQGCDQGPPRMLQNAFDAEELCRLIKKLITVCV